MTELSNPPHAHVEAIPTGIPKLDEQLLYGGYPLGEMTEIYGNPSVGKSTLAIQAARECQRQGGTVAWIDAEHTFDQGWAAQQGVEREKLIVIRPHNEACLTDAMLRLLQSRTFSLIVVDSLPAIGPKPPIVRPDNNGLYGDQTFVTKLLAKLHPHLQYAHTALIWINQAHMSSPSKRSAAIRSYGGRSVALRCTLRLHLQHHSILRENGLPNGTRSHIHIVRDGPFKPRKPVSFEISFSGTP